MTAARPDSPLEASERPPLRALVVEPHAETRARIVGLVAAIGDIDLELEIEIDEAGDGTTALASWSERRHRLVITEVVLEGTSGLGLLRRIRAETPAASDGITGPTVALGRRASAAATTGATSVIIVSQMARDADRYWGLRQGATAYFGKPFADDALASAIRRVLGHTAFVPDVG